MDIKNKNDIQHLVDTFYTKVRKNDTIGHFFNNVVDIDWEDHMPIMYNFWDSILFGGREYKGNPMTKHVELNEKSPMEKEHFNTWLALWTETVDELFSGEKAEEVKKRASSIAGLMEFQVKQGR